MLDIITRRKRLFGRCNIEQMMLYTAHFFSGDLTAPDIETSVYLTRICGNHFAFKAPGKFYSERTLTRGRRTDNNQNFMHRSTLLQAPAFVSNDRTIRS